MMKKILYTRPDGGLSVVGPAEGFRLARAVNAAKDGTTIVSSKIPVPVDTLVRPWPQEGVVAEWAESEDEFVARVVAKDVPTDATNVTIVDESAIPVDRTFRNAWENDGAAVKVNMPKAREIHREHLRRMRAPKLAALDVEYQRADEKNAPGDKAAIAAKKQALRDATKDPAIDAAATPEELAAVIPVALKE